MKPYIVLFIDGYAHIIPDHRIKSYRLKRGRYLVNPDLHAVQHVPRHFWKLGQGDSVVEMTPDEKRARLAEIERKPVRLLTHPTRSLYSRIDLIVYGAAVAGVLIYLYRGGLIHG